MTSKMTPASQFLPQHSHPSMDVNVIEQEDTMPASLSTVWVLITILKKGRGDWCHPQTKEKNFIVWQSLV